MAAVDLDDCRQCHISDGGPHMTDPTFSSGPHRDLRWWRLIFVFGFLISWLFLAFDEATVFVELVKAIVLALGGIGLKALWDKR
jgi:hypothetical protein